MKSVNNSGSILQNAFIIACKLEDSMITSNSQLKLIFTMKLLLPISSFLQIKNIAKRASFLNRSPICYATKFITLIKDQMQNLLNLRINLVIGGFYQ